MTVRGYVNPTKDQLAAMKGYTLQNDAKELVYEDKDKDGNERVTISFWLQADAPEKPWFNAKFQLVDKPAVTKPEEGKVQKIQFVNQSGGDFGSTWIDDEKNLPDWFKFVQEGKKPDRKNVADRQFRSAIVGEAELYQFLHHWYAHVQWDKPMEGVYSSLFVDVKRLFRNVDKYVQTEYQPLIDVQNALDKAIETGDKGKAESLKKEILVGPVTAMAIVTSKDTDEGTKHYQNLYKQFMGGYQYKKVLFAVQNNKWDADKGLASWHKQVTSPEYGCQGAYTLTTLQAFDPENHIQSSAQTFVPADNKAPEDISY